MSHITNIVLLCQSSDAKLVQNRLPVAGKPVDPQQLTGGSKVFCKALFAWAENYLRQDELFTAIEALPWESPSGVMLLIEDENEVCPAVYRLGETQPYTHNPNREWTLGEISLDEGETLQPPPKLVRVVRARAD